MKTATVLLASSLFLSACGGTDASAAPDPAQTPDADAAADDQPIELTDADMEKYVAISREIRETKDGFTDAFLTRHGLSLEQWMKLNAAVTRGMVSASRIQLSDTAAKSKADLDKRIAALEAQRQTAPEAQRAELQKQLDALKAGRSTFTDLEPLTDLDRRNAATWERWKPKLDELARQK